MIHWGQHVTCDISWKDEFSLDYIRLGGTTQIDWQPESRWTLSVSLLEATATRNVIRWSDFSAQICLQQENQSLNFRMLRKGILNSSREIRAGFRISWAANPKPVGTRWTWTSTIPAQVSFTVRKRPRSSLNRPLRQGQCLGNAAGFLVIVGKSETSSITSGWCLNWNSAALFYAVKNSIERTRPYIWSWVWPIVVLDDWWTPVVRWCDQPWNHILFSISLLCVNA